MSVIGHWNTRNELMFCYPSGGDAMSDDKTKTGGRDRELISLSEDYEVRDWAAKFGVSEKALRDAIGRVGNGAADVERELGGRR
jgi:hypothetical protein